MGASSSLVDSAEPPAEPSVSAVDPPCPSPVEVLSTQDVDVSEAGDSPDQDIVDSAEPDIISSAEEFTGPQPVVPAHSCGHEHEEEEEPDQLAAEPLHG